MTHPISQEVQNLATKRDPHVAIMDAAKRGRGLRLTAEECAYLASDSAKEPTTPAKLGQDDVERVAREVLQLQRNAFAAGFEAAERALGFEGSDESDEALKIEWNEYRKTLAMEV